VDVPHDPPSKESWKRSKKMSLQIIPVGPFSALREISEYDPISPPLKTGLLFILTIQPTEGCSDLPTERIYGAFLNFPTARIMFGSTATACGISNSLTRLSFPVYHH